MLKTRKEILEDDYNSAMVQKIENEINVRHLTRESLIINPGKDYDVIQTNIFNRKKTIEKIDKVLKVIEEMINEEGKLNGKKV